MNLIKINKKLSSLYVPVLLILLSSTAYATGGEVSTRIVVPEKEVVTVAVNEGQKKVADVRLKNGAGDSYIWIHSGQDKDFFTLTNNTSLKFKNAPEFLYPRDADRNNVYEVVLQAKDDKYLLNQSIEVTVRDVKYPYIKNFLYQRKDTPKRSKHNRWVCKRSTALNFNAIGRHKEELCLSENDVRRILGEMAVMMDRKTSSEKGITKTSPQSATDNSKNISNTTNTSLKTPSIDKPLKTKVSIKSSPSRIVVAKTLAEVKLDSETKELALTEEMNKDDLEKGNQEASIYKAVDGESRNWFFQYFWGIIIFLALAVWLLWKIFARDENIENPDIY